MGGTSTIGSGPSNGTTMFESYIVNALKKQNREMRHELDEKKDIIEKLKRDLKLTKNNEIEHEL